MAILVLLEFIIMCLALCAASDFDDDEDNNETK